MSERLQLILFGWSGLLTGMKKLLCMGLHLHMGSSLEQVEDNFHVGADTQTFSPCSKVQLGILLKRNDLPMI